MTFYSPVVVVQSSNPSDNCLAFDSERRSLFSRSASLPWPFGTEPSYRAVESPGSETLKDTLSRLDYCLSPFTLPLCLFLLEPARVAWPRYSFNWWLTV
jgi:hypothetical protein